MASFSPLLEEYYEPLPYIFLGIAAIFGGLIYAKLPETLNKRLPDSMDEASREEFIEIDKSDDESPECTPLLRQQNDVTMKDNEELK